MQPFLKSTFFVLLLCWLALTNVWAQEYGGGDEEPDEGSGSQPTLILRPDSNANLMYSASTSIYRLHSYIGQQIKFMRPLGKRHSFTLDRERAYVLPHIPFEEDELGRQSKRNLETGFISQEKYQEHKQNYEDYFTIRSNLAFAKMERMDKLSMNASINEDGYLYTNENEILKENWIITGIRNLPSPDEAAHKSHWDDPEFLLGTEELKFELQGTKTGTKILWVPDMYYRCEKPDDYDGIYYMPYVNKSKKRFKTGAKYVALNDLMVDKPGGYTDFLKKGDVLVYGGFRQNSKKRADGKIHTMFMHAFAFKNDTVFLPLNIKVYTGQTASKDPDEASRQMYEYDLEPVSLYNQRSKISSHNRATPSGEVINIEQAELNKEEPRASMLLQKYGERYGEMILEGKICLGMSKDMVHEAWGAPDQSTVQSRMGNQTIVMEIFPNLSWARFKNGKVVGYGGGF